jgi:hypothetical protein
LPTHAGLSYLLNPNVWGVVELHNFGLEFRPQAMLEDLMLVQIMCSPRVLHDCQVLENPPRAFHQKLQEVFGGHVLQVGCLSFGFQIYLHM